MAERKGGGEVVGAEMMRIFRQNGSKILTQLLFGLQAGG